jgi:hypothetical protein
VLNKFTGIQACSKLLGTQKPVVVTVKLTGPGRTGGGGNRLDQRDRRISVKRLTIVVFPLPLGPERTTIRRFAD